jgi:plastocyanin
VASSLAAVVAAAAALWLAPGAAASNTRVSISNFAWSNPEVQVNLGEKVTWDWIGPDLAHSVTGISPNALQWDSDPQTNQPQHRLGDSYAVSFDKPGVYEFRCKLHSTVRGEVVVSDRPGDPEAEPDPVPKSQVDMKAPRIRGIALKRRKVGRRGAVMRYTLNERAKVDAEYWRYERRGKGKRARTKKRFQGWTSWKGHIGYNTARLGAPAKRFKPRPGRYVVELRATDDSNNTSKVKRVRFTIRER